MICQVGCEHFYRDVEITGMIVSAVMTLLVVVIFYLYFKLKQKEAQKQ